jgi:hypothetical protein
MICRLSSLVALAFSLTLPLQGAPVTHFSLTMPNPVTVHPGQPFSLKVTALDASNAAVTDYTGTVHFSSTPAVALPADYTFAAEDNGVRSFNITSTVAGWLIITAKEAGNASISGTAATYVIIPCPPGVAPVITTLGRVCAGSSANMARVSGVGPASLLWTITNGTITAGQGTDTITFTAGESGVVGFDVRATGAGPCYPSRVVGHTEIFPLPVIDSQSERVQVRKGQTALLTVFSTTPGVTYEWFEGNVGDTTAPIDNPAAELTTPALERNTHYWVRLTTSCGSTDSAPIIAQVTGKSRSARH